MLILSGHLVPRVLKSLASSIRDLGGRSDLMTGLPVEINDVYSSGEGCVGRSGQHPICIQEMQ